MSDREYFLTDQIDFYKQQIAQFEDFYDKANDEEEDGLIPVINDLKDKLARYEEELERLKDPLTYFA